ncbi:MAG: hypothetical protein JWP95_1529 [Actinotalea sp.]|nr:hypothetical protein [Actinotalea sp.]
MAGAVLAAEEALLRQAQVPGELVLVGGSSVPGALTRGDVDLHLRVEPPDFPTAVDRLRAVHAVVHPAVWGPSLATFALGEVAPGVPAGLAVTPVGSEHDLRFSRSWTLLAADPDLVRAYNRMKTADDGPDGPAYEDRKSAFFDSLLALWPTHAAGGLRSW